MSSLGASFVRLRSKYFAAIVIVVIGAALLAAPAGADTAADLSAARQKVADAQAAANGAAAELSKAEARSEELEIQIGRLEGGMRTAQERVAVLQDVVKQRALSAYVRGGSTGSSDVDMLLSSGNALDAARRSQLLDNASQKDNRDVRKLVSLRADLHEQQKEVEAQRVAQQQVNDQLVGKNQSVQAALVAANNARDELVARLEKEQADAAAAAELARLKAAQAARQVVAPQGPGGSGGAGQIIVNPGGGPFQCPLVGSAYNDSYGPRDGGFHYGIDMFAPAGVPEVAVKAGTVSYIPNGGAGGNEAYLAANDGNVYYYAHMSSFVGGPRSVAQGEIIGLVGSTGRSTGPHLHFEIRIGGANGQRIDPFPTLQAAGC